MNNCPRCHDGGPCPFCPAARVDAAAIAELEEIYCDMHKDVYGVKARWIRFATVEEGEAALKQLSAALQVEMAHDAECQRLAIEAFEELVRSCPDRETAIRWQHQAYGTNGDDEFLAYSLGLPYGYFRKAA